LIDTFSRCKTNHISIYVMSFYISYLLILYKSRSAKMDQSDPFWSDSSMIHKKMSWIGLAHH